MSSPTAFEFLLVSGNYQTLTAVSGGLKRVGASLGFAPTSDVAREYVGRHKVDGIFVDLEIPGAQELIHVIRRGFSNRDAVVFACVPSVKDSPVRLVSGVTFLLQKPLTAESVASHVTAAENIMAGERRRYFRHAASCPIFLTANGTEQRAMMTNLSEGGMAVRVGKPVEYPSVIDFTFELSPGAPVSGKGLVAWENAEGMTGIKFQFFRGDGRERIQAWLRERQPSIPQRVKAAQLERKPASTPRAGHRKTYSLT